MKHFFLCAVSITVLLRLAISEAPVHETNIAGGDITIITNCPQSGVTCLTFMNPVVSTEEVVVDGETFTDIWIEGENQLSEPGLPQLPVVNRVIGIPDRGDIRLRILKTEYIEQPINQVYPSQGVEDSSNFMCNREFYRQGDWYPEPIVTLSEPAVLRDVRLVAISVYPIQYNPASSTIRVYRHIDIQVEPAPGSGINEKVRSFTHPSAHFGSLYRQLENYQYLGLDQNEPSMPGQYLIICPNYWMLIEDAEVIAQWKRRKGIPTWIEPMSAQMSSATEIKEFIQDAYENWDPPLEYVLLLGDHCPNNTNYHIPGFFQGTSPGFMSDHPYTQLAGDDILGDIAIGRLSAQDISTMDLIITKTIHYEQNLHVSQTGTEWFTKGYLLAGISHGMTSTIHTMEYIRSMMYHQGFDEVVLHMHNGRISATLLHQQLAMGRSYLFSRPAYAHEMECSDLNGLNNGWKLPFVAVLTCYTGNFGGLAGTNLSECWIQYGSIANGGGAVACIGTAGGGVKTRVCNVVAAGIADGFFVDGSAQAGVALMEGKFQIFRNFPNDMGQMVPFQTVKHNLMGDPSLEIWTAVPTEFSVTHPSVIPIGCNRLPVLVEDNCSHNPVGGALVCAMKGEETWARMFTDESGYVEMPIEPQTEGILWLTASKTNYQPYTADVSVDQCSLYVAYTSAEIDDDSVGGTHGNNNGELNPGEIVDLTVTAHNYGSVLSAVNMVGILTSSDTSLAQVTVDQQPFPDISPGSEAQSQGAFRINLSPLARDQDLTPLIMQFQTPQQVDTSLVPLMIYSGRAEFDSLQFLLSNNRLDPGEIEELVVSIANNGHHSITSLRGHILTSDSLVWFFESDAVFGDFPMGGVADNTDDPFVVYADSNIIPGHSVVLRIALTGDGEYTDTTCFGIQVGVPEDWDPTGPDSYGYYCFDDTDTAYQSAPQYHWIEADPNFGGNGLQLPIYDNYENADDNVVQALPFTFRMYGVDYDTITICSNGWAALGNQEQFVDCINYHIPGPMGPDAMLSIFWDDLIVSNGHVCWEYREDEGLLIIEWSRVATRCNYNAETFEILLYDPAVWLTPTGDGMIIYQYMQVVNAPGYSYDNDYATVGIEDHSQTDGVELSYWNYYSPGAAPLQPGRAYLFATLESQSHVDDAEQVVPLSYTLEPNYPNPFNATTSISYSLPQPSPVTLTVYNLLGQKIATLVQGRQEAGHHRALFDGGSLSSGIYFYHLEAVPYTKTRKMVLLK
jgi:hypothetical protein